MIGKIALFFILLLSQTYASDSTQYRFSRNVVFNTQDRQVLLAVALDPAVYVSSAKNFSDLQLLDQNGVETPFWLQTIGGSITVVNHIPIHSNKIRLQKTGTEGFAVSVEIDKDLPDVDGLTVITHQRDFEYVLQIQGSNDGTEWHTLVDQAVIYDYSRFMNFGNRDIELPKNSYRFFKINVAHAIQEQASKYTELSRTLINSRELERKETIDLHREPLHIESIKFWHKETETHADVATRFEYPLSNINISRNAEEKISFIEIDAYLLPLNGIKLNTSTPNFSRKAEVQVPLQRGIEPYMQTISQGKLEALHFQNIKREQVTLDFPLQRQTHYRLVIHDQDNPPLQIESVTGIGPGYQLIFLAQPGQQYRLLYGADKVDMPHYDTAAIQELLRRGYKSKPANLGPETKIAMQSQKFDLSDVLNSDIFLGLVLVMMILILSWSLYRVYQKIG